MCVRSVKTPIPFKEVEGRIVKKPEMVAQLELTPRKEVFIFVHGFNNTFDDAAFAMAELWHFLGRIGVPVVYLAGGLPRRVWLHL